MPIPLSHEQCDLININTSLHNASVDFNNDITTNNKFNTIIEQYGMTAGLAHVLQYDNNSLLVGSENLSKVFGEVKKTIIKFFDMLVDFCKKLFKWIREKIGMDEQFVSTIKTRIFEQYEKIKTGEITSVNDSVSINQLSQLSALYTKVFSSNRMLLLPNDDIMNKITITLSEIVDVVNYEFTKNVLENDVSWANMFEEKYRNDDNGNILAHKEFNNKFYNRYRDFHNKILPKLQFLGIGCSKFPSAGGMPYDNNSWVTYTNSEINKHLKTNTLIGHGYVKTDKDFYKTNAKFNSLPITLPNRYDCIDAITLMESHMTTIRKSIGVFDYISDSIGDAKAKFSYQMHSATHPELYEHEPIGGVLIEVWRELLNNLFTLRQLTDIIIGYIGRMSGLIRVAVQTCYNAHEIRYQFESTCIKYQLQHGAKL